MKSKKNKEKTTLVCLKGIWYSVPVSLMMKFHKWVTNSTWKQLAQIKKEDCVRYDLKAGKWKKVKSK